MFLPYLLTPWRRVLLEKLTGLQLVKKFPAFHGTRKFITARTSVRHLSLSWASPIQSIYPHPTSWRSILILSTQLRLGLPSGLLPSGKVYIHMKIMSKKVEWFEHDVWTGTDTPWYRHVSWCGVGHFGLLVISLSCYNMWRKCSKKI